MRERRPLRAAPACGALGLLAVAVAASAPLAGGCDEGRCEGSTLVLRAETNRTGRMVGPDRWESGALEEQWLDFSHQRLIAFEIPELASRRVVSITPYIGTSPKPTVGTDIFTLASGNLAVVQYVPPGGGRSTWFSVRNDTCADYYVRVVVELEPAASSSGDAGADTRDSSLADAPAE